MTLHSIPAAAKALTEWGKPISACRLYAIVAKGELKHAIVGGRMCIVDLETQILEKARTQTAARQRPQFSIVTSDRIRRFGTADRKAVSQ